MPQLPVGLAINRPKPSAVVEAIVRAEEGGLSVVWSTVGGTNPDAVTILAVAATRTEQIRLGTSIVPAYPRHPIVLASQALVLADLAPGRFRLGIGPSHRPTIEGMFGLRMENPLLYMREYLTVLRQLLWDGRADFEGEFLTVHASLPSAAAPPRTPLLLSALRVNAFRQAGEISDGAISWVCPIPYLVETALPALREGAESGGRPVPPLVAHVPVILSRDRETVRSTAREFLGRYARLPFYARMFATAGYEVGSDGQVPENLADEVVVSGDGPAVVKRLEQILAEGIDELLVTLLPVADPTEDERNLIAALASSPVVPYSARSAPESRRTG